MAIDDVRRRLLGNEPKEKSEGLPITYFRAFEITVGDLRECCGSCTHDEHAKIVAGLLDGVKDHSPETKVVVDRNQIEAIVGMDAATSTKARRPTVATPPPEPTKPIQT
jgi:hypothetical protein